MRRVPLLLVLAALLIHSALLVFINLAFGADIVGLNTLTANLMFCLLVGGVVLGRSDLRLRDVGLQRQHLATGVGFLGWVLFGSSIVLLAASALLPGLWLVVDWVRLEPYRLGLALISHLFVIAPYEEAFFRGFVFVQLYLAVHDRLPKWAMLTALFASQLLFALGHVPNVVWVGSGVDELSLNTTRLLFNGLLYTFIYLLTGNLFAAIGVHALHNLPPLVLENSSGTLWTLTSSLILLSGLLVAFVYWRLQATSLLARLQYKTPIHETPTHETPTHQTSSSSSNR